MSGLSLSLVDWEDFDAALFDLDGVLTPTAEVHMRAWRDLFTDFLTRRGLVERPYVEADYFDHIDGKPRYDGVRAFLASRDLTLPDGEPDDSPQPVSVSGESAGSATARTRSSPRRWPTRA